MERQIKEKDYTAFLKNMGREILFAYGVPSTFDDDSYLNTLYFQWQCQLLSTPWIQIKVYFPQPIFKYSLLGILSSNSFPQSTHNSGLVSNEAKLITTVFPKYVYSK